MVGAIDRPGLILDADVLIDFLGSDPAVLSLVNQHIDAIHVPYPLLQELKKVHFPNHLHLELNIFHPEPSILEEALLTSLRPPRVLSFYDCLCLFLARDKGWICATNDKALRKVCENEGIRLLWGLECFGLQFHWTPI